MSASSLTSFTVQFNRSVPIPIFIFGLFGNLFNILVFTRPRLIKNPCSTFFFCASIANLNVLFFGLVARYLSDGFGIDPSLYNIGYCRFRYFILHSSMTLSSWLTVLAGIDRYCISSRNVHRRQLSNLKYARYSTAITIGVCLAMYSHALALFTIEQLKTGPYCYAQAGSYRTFYDFFYFATYSFTPPIVMITVGLATVYNVRLTGRNVSPLTTNVMNANQLKRRDRQLIRMALVQFLITIVFTLPIAIQKLYSTFTQTVVKDAYRLAAENFVAQLLRMFVFINSSASFYVFVISGKGFRHEFSQIIMKGVGYVFGVHGRCYRQVQKIMESPSTVQTLAANRTATMFNHQKNVNNESIASEQQQEQ